MIKEEHYLIYIDMKTHQNAQSKSHAQGFEMTQQHIPPQMDSHNFDSLEQTKSFETKKILTKRIALLIILMIFIIPAFIGLNRYINEQNYLCFVNFPPWSPAPPIDLGQEMLLVKTRYEGIKMAIDSKDQVVSRVIAQNGYWQPDNMKTFGRFVKQGDTFVNIGAHIGFEGVVYGKKVGPKGRAFYFEPAKRTNKVLRKNIELNGLSQISTIYDKGVSDSKFTGYSILNFGNTGGGSIIGEETFQKMKQRPQVVTKVQIDLVDNILPKDVKINFALIDVEKLEVPCLLGMKEVIARSPDIIIVTEWWAKSSSANREQYRDKLHDLLDFFDTHNLVFWSVDRTWFGLGGPRSCGKQNFIKWTRASFEQFNEWIYFHDQMIDLMIAAGHIDINQL